MKSIGGDTSKKPEKEASLDAAMNQAAQVLTQQMESMPATEQEPWISPRWK